MVRMDSGYLLGCLLWDHVNSMYSIRPLVGRNRMWCDVKFKTCTAKRHVRSLPVVDGLP